MSELTLADFGISQTLLARLVLIFVVFQALVLASAFMVWMERKVCAYIQDREGPNRVGPAGLLQPFADVIKLVFKEDLRPKAADAFLFAIAPIISRGAYGSVPQRSARRFAPRHARSYM